MDEVHHTRGDEAVEAECDRFALAHQLGQSIVDEVSSAGVRLAKGALLGSVGHEVWLHERALSILQYVDCLLHAGSRWELCYDACGVLASHTKWREVPFDYRIEVHSAGESRVVKRIIVWSKLVEVEVVEKLRVVLDGNATHLVRAAEQRSNITQLPCGHCVGVPFVAAVFKDVSH